MAEVLQPAMSLIEKGRRLDLGLDVRKWRMFDDDIHRWDLEIYRAFDLLDHFVRICEHRGLQTIMDACQRHPSLAAHFYEADFALKRRRSLDMRREFRAVTLPLLQRMVMPSSASALPLHICSRILGFAEPVVLPSWDLWTAEAPAAVLFGQWLDCEGTSPDATHALSECSLLMQYTNSDAMSATAHLRAYPDFFKNFYRYMDDLMPCVHMPVALFFDEYRRRLEGWLEEGDHHWETDMFTVLHARQLLQALLLAIGFDTLEAAEAVYPFILVEHIESYIRESEEHYHDDEAHDDEDDDDITVAYATDDDDITVACAPDDDDAPANY
jgi:hypothetical protein